MTTTLPSFVELMASLGLDNTSSTTTGPARHGSGTHHSRSSSYSSISSVSSQASSTVSSTHSSTHSDIYSNSSPSIVISRERDEHNLFDRDWDMERRRTRAARFSPYGPAISHTRRGSMPVMPTDEDPEERPNRALSTSPRISSQRTAGRRGSVLSLRNHRPEKLRLSDGDLPAHTPISTFVRRKTPQTSPTSPTFPTLSKKRSSSPSLPVSIPTLPQFFPPATYTGYNTSDTDDDDMQTDPPQHRLRGARYVVAKESAVRSYRSGGIGRRSLLQASALENRQRHISPIA
ncbi:hypothetical protein CERSUDRAFT_91297 [Gelatoporia subvermispora B]|uniref:Uncharacterized protein n=1 Tax=Ceriporiopsis subvermispora (strain B) TaxID=914234 RepID=M2RNY9_CERS8|nr:hypothetical protein CERSUDRAFT_91297 [Gelatoporia subvermispora B]